MSHILIVDDHEENRYLLEFALKSANHEVTSATNGAEAIAKARIRAPDLIVADILMPVMDGFTLCRQWRADDKLKGIPFIFYTATYTDTKDEALALSLGADRFILKPQGPEVIVANVEELIAMGVGVHEPVNQPDPDERVTLREYNTTLIRKLEKKLFDLEAALKMTAIENAERLQAEEHSRKLYEETERSRQALLSILEDQKESENRIQDQLAELRRWQTVTVGREDRVLQLKREVNEVLVRFGEAPRYAITDQDGL